MNYYINADLFLFASDAQGTSMQQYSAMIALHDTAPTTSSSFSLNTTELISNMTR